MAMREKSYIRQIILSFLGLSMISILVMAVTFFMVDSIYRQRIDQEITSFTQIITQNVDNFFLAPEDYLLSIRDHIDERLDWQEDPSEDYFIQDVIKLIPDFEEILLLGPEGRVLKPGPPPPNPRGWISLIKSIFIVQPIQEKSYGLAPSSPTKRDSLQSPWRWKAKEAVWWPSIALVVWPDLST
jgi:hypothetical protein